MEYDDCKTCFMDVLDAYAPLKKKSLRGNNPPLNKNPSEVNKANYKKTKELLSHYPPPPPSA